MFEGQFGIEREAIRISEMGDLSQYPHPKAFKETNPYITKDFAEAQIEMITPPCNSIDEAVHLIEDIQQVVLENLEHGDMLWKQSNPPVISEDIKIASFKSNPEKEAYRNYLLEKYGKEKSVFSGIHFNFSFSNTIIEDLFKDSKEKDFIDFKNKLYLKVTKYILKNRWFYIYLTSASPVFHNSFYEHCVLNSKQKNTGDCIIEGMNSLRNSNCGYRNKEDIILNFDSWQEYKESIKTIIDNGDITGPSELYTPVRIKEDKNGNIAYLELRFIDINPFTTSGISKTDLKYLHLHLIYALFEEEVQFDEAQQVRANMRHVSATKENQLDKEAMLKIHNKVKDFFKETPYNLKDITKSIEERIEDEEKTYAKRLKKAYETSSFIDYHLEQSIREIYASKKSQFTLKTDDTLELSTKILIKEAIKEGYTFEILDSKSNFITITHNNQTEYIQQATKTNLDKYANVLAMENKVVTKKILERNKISVPKGYILEAKEDIKKVDLDVFKDEGIVIKPNTTNFGEGITIFPNGADKTQIIKAIDFAFSKDDTILLESFIKGQEYRFLIIDQKVVGVLHRRAANVIGDGTSTIRELVEEKNKNPLRGQNYKTPLEKIQLKEKELEFLKLQNLNFESIPKENETIYLRENSNISTGGDSIDYTDKTHTSYIKIAEAAAKAMNINITGVDLITEDITKPCKYSILELNFNPAIHIHTYPLIGTNRHPAKKILDTLFKGDKHD